MKQCRTGFLSGREYNNDFWEDEESHIKKIFRWLIDRYFLTQSNPKEYENKVETDSSPRNKPREYQDKPKTGSLSWKKPEEYENKPQAGYLDKPKTCPFPQKKPEDYQNKQQIDSLDKPNTCSLPQKKPKEYENEAPGFLPPKKPKCEKKFEEKKCEEMGVPQDQPPRESRINKLVRDDRIILHPTATATGYSDHRIISSPTNNDLDDFLGEFPQYDFFNFDEVNWAYRSRIGPSGMIPPTVDQATQNVIEPGYHMNFNIDVEQNNNIMTRHISQEELHTTNNTNEERYNTLPYTIHASTNSNHQDTIRNSSNTTPVVVDIPRTKKISISLEVLQRHFKMSMDDAAKSLDVSRSTLKRICRENGIQRWPACNRKGKKINDEQSPNPKKVNELDKMNNINQPNKSTRMRGLIDDPCREASSIRRNVMIRATYGDDTVKFPLSISCGLDDLKAKTCKWLGINISIKFKCKDEDGDLVLIACDDALHKIFGNKLVDHNSTFDFSVFQDTNNKV